MNGKIQNLKNAYASGNHDKLFRAACALVNYDKKHPFAVCGYAGAEELVALAKDTSSRSGVLQMSPTSICLYFATAFASVIVFINLIPRMVQ